jgi:hypothetical protein
MREAPSPDTLALQSPPNDRGSLKDSVEPQYDCEANRLEPPANRLAGCESVDPPGVSGRKRASPRRHLPEPQCRESRKIGVWRQ